METDCIKDEINKKEFVNLINNIDIKIKIKKHNEENKTVYNCLDFKDIVKMIRNNIYLKGIIINPILFLTFPLFINNYNFPSNITKLIISMSRLLNITINEKIKIQRFIFNIPNKITIFELKIFNSRYTINYNYLSSSITYLSLQTEQENIIFPNKIKKIIIKCPKFNFNLIPYKTQIIKSNINFTVKKNVKYSSHFIKDVNMLTDITKQIGYIMYMTESK